MLSRTVAAIMSRDVVTLDVDVSFNLASSVMRLRHIRHLPVVEAGRLVGLVTHRDIAQAQAAYLVEHSLEPDRINAPVRGIMHTEVWTVAPETPVLEAARIMYDHKFGCLPVVSGGLLVGIVTEHDLVRLLVDELERERDEDDDDDDGGDTSPGRSRVG